MKANFINLLLLICFLTFGFEAIAQQKKSSNRGTDLTEIGTDFNSRLPQSSLIGTDPEMDAISAAWSTLAVSPKPHSRSFCVYARPGGTEYLYQFGGGSGTQLKSIARYDIAANTWTLLAQALNLDVSSGTAINDGDSVIYIFGGNSGTSTLGSTQKFNIITGITTTLATMPNLITDAAVVKYRDSLVYVIGGGTGLFGTGYINNVNVYNINTNTYSAATAYPVAAGMMGFGIDGNKIICAGGWDGVTGIANAYKGVIDPTNHLNITWTAIPNYPGGGVTRTASYFVSKGSGRGVVFTGGALLGATLQNKTYFFSTDPNCEAWDSTAVISQARSNFKAAGRGDSVAWVVSGFTTVGVGTTERITFSSITCPVVLADDVGTLSINSPATTVILPSPAITPQATVKNFGSNTETFNVTMTISPGGYSSTKTVTGLTSFSTSNVDFDPYSPLAGSYTVSVYTQLGSDLNRANDTLRRALTVVNPNFATTGGFSYSNSVTGTGAPSQPDYCWKDTAGSTSLCVNSVNANAGIFTGSLDDGYWAVRLPAGKKIRLGGVSYDSFFVATNGIVGFARQSGLTSFSPSQVSTNRPAIYPLWQDMNLTANASYPVNRVSYKIIGYQLIITYDRIPEYTPVGTDDYITYQVVIDLVEQTYSADSRFLVQYHPTETGAGYINFYNTDGLNAHVIGIQSASGTINSYYRAAYPLSLYGPMFGASPIAVQFGPDANRLNASCNATSLTLTASIEAITPNSSSDTITVLLRASTFPYEIVDAASGVLSSSGSASLSFTKANLGSSYYIVVKHRNTIETWSANPVAFTADASYDFTSGISQAYGSNMVVISGDASFYSGDANQDGFIDASDGSLVDNDAFNFNGGYIPTDINNDGFVDASDAAYVDNNAFNFVGIVRP